MDKDRKRPLCLKGYNLGIKTKEFFEVPRHMPYRSDRISSKGYVNPIRSIYHHNKENMILSKKPTTDYRHSLNLTHRNSLSSTIFNTFYSKLDYLLAEMEIFESFKRSYEVSNFIDV